MPSFIQFIIEKFKAPFVYMQKGIDAVTSQHDTVNGWPVTNRERRFDPSRSARTSVSFSEPDDSRNHEGYRNPEGAKTEPVLPRTGSTPTHPGWRDPNPNPAVVAGGVAAAGISAGSSGGCAGGAAGGGTAGGC